MPLYEFYCRDCEAKFEALRPMSEADEPVPCPSCHGLNTTRLLSLFAARSKGEGGEARSLSSGACSSCTASSCSTCGLR